MSAEKKTDLIQLVSFALAGEEYGVEVLNVREIIRMPEITLMPNSGIATEGIINLRGKVIPVISMRKSFGLPEATYDAQTRIMVMDVAGGLTGFVVDAVSEVIRIHPSEIQPPPEAGGGPTDPCITGVYNRDGRMLITVDVEVLCGNSKLELLDCNNDLTQKMIRRA